MNIETMKKAVVDALEDIKGFDITVIDVGHLTSITSCMIVASATSTRHAKSLAQNVEDKVKQLGVTVYGVEGEKEGEWVLIDLGDIIAHVMLPATRAYYNLEQLWGAAAERRQAVSTSSIN
jgi:ribosome-associated protein